MDLPSVREEGEPRRERRHRNRIYAAARVFSDGDLLFVTDSGNHRVLVFESQD